MRSTKLRRTIGALAAGSIAVAASAVIVLAPTSAGTINSLRSQSYSSEINSLAFVNSLGDSVGTYVNSL